MPYTATKAEENSMTSHDTESRHERVARLRRALPYYDVPHRNWLVASNNVFHGDGRPIVFGYKARNQERLHEELAHLRGDTADDAPVGHLIFVPNDELQASMYGALQRTPLMLAAFTLVNDGPDIVVHQLVAWNSVVDAVRTVINKDRGYVIVVRPAQLSAWDGGVAHGSEPELLLPGDQPGPIYIRNSYLRGVD
jgi:hypothetical protein